MFQTLMLSALIAVGQPPTPAVKPKQPSPLEAAVTRALQSHPDIRVAEAEVQVAQAKLAQAKLKIAQQVTALHADMDRLKVAVDSTAQTMAMTEQLVQKGQGAMSELAAARATYAAARATLAKAEAEYNALVGPAPAAATFTGRVNDLTLMDALGVAFSADGQYLATQHPDGSVRIHPTGGVAGITRLSVTPGSPADKLKAVLDKSVKMDEQKNATLKDVLDALVKAAGLDVRVRTPDREDATRWRDVARLTLPAGEYPVGTWLEMILDETAQRGSDPRADRSPARYEIYVREYGLLVTTSALAPTGAITVSDLRKQAQADKAKKK